MERRGPPLGSPQDVGVERPARTARVENGQQERQLQAVGRDRPEETERAVDLDAAGAVRRSCRQIQQPVELQPPEEQPQAARIGPLEGDDDAHRSQQDRLLLRGLVGGDQGRAADRLETNEEVILLQVREQRVPHVRRRQAEVGRRRRDHRLGRERLRVAQGAPRRRGAGEDGPPERGRVHVVPRLEHATVLDELAQPPHEPVVGLVIRHVVARRVEGLPGPADPRTRDGDVPLRDSEQSLLLVRPQRRDFDAPGAAPRPHEINRQHRAPAGGRWSGPPDVPFATSS